MSVQLEPSEVLTFKRPLTRTSKEVLFIRNTSDGAIAFKVKTTAPKLYCVRPNAGFVGAGETQEVQVMLQPFKEEPPMGQKCKDKFLVLTVPLVDEIKDMELAGLWPHVESKEKGLIRQIKLRCNYLPEDIAEEAEKKLDDVPPVVSSKLEIVEPEILSPAPAERQLPEATPVVDEMAKMRMELDAYRSELESLRSQAPIAAVDTSVAKSVGISWPLVALIALLSFLVSFVVLKQTA